jgi:hypothetical protein
MFLAAQVTNTGQVSWIGYETGLSRGLTQVGVDFIDQSGQPIKIKAGIKSRLYVSGMPKPGETVRAIGRVTFPQQPGKYRMILELGVSGIKKPEDVAKPTYEFSAQVLP